MVIITIFHHKDIMINSAYNKANVMNQLKNMVHQHNISSRMNQLINVYHHVFLHMFISKMMKVNTFVW